MKYNVMLLWVTPTYFNHSDTFFSQNWNNELIVSKFIHFKEVHYSWNNDIYKSCRYV